MLQAKNINYQLIEAEENPDLIDKYEVTNAPTLVIEGNHLTKLINLSDIENYINQA